MPTLAAPCQSAVLKKARVGREPELRQLEAQIEAAEIVSVREGGGKAIKAADELLRANNFEQARAKLSEARSAFSKGPNDAEQDSAFKVMKELEQQIEASQWFKNSAPGNGRASIGMQPFPPHRDNGSSSPLSHDRGRRIERGNALTAATRGTSPSRVQVAHGSRRDGTPHRGVVGDRALEGESVPGQVPGQVSQQVGAIESEERATEQEQKDQWYLTGVRRLADAESYCKLGDLNAARKALNEARRSWHRCGRLEDKTSELRATEHAILEEQGRQERRQLDEWEEKNRLEKEKFEADFSAKSVEMTKAEIDDLMRRRREMAEEAAEIARRKALAHDERRRAWLGSDTEDSQGAFEGRIDERSEEGRGRSRYSPSAAFGSEDVKSEVSILNRILNDDLDDRDGDRMEMLPRAASSDAEITVMGMPVVEKGASEKFGSTAPPINHVTALVGEKTSVTCSRRLLGCIACGGCVFSVLFIALANLHVL